MKPKTKLISVCAAAAMLMLSTAYAWDGAVTGSIVTIDEVANGPGNYDTRIYLGGSPVMCSGSAATWAYLNVSDPNYSAVVASLMMAKVTRSQVTVYTNRDSGGYCHIGYLSIT